MPAPNIGHSFFPAQGCDHPHFWIGVEDLPNEREKPFNQRQRHLACLAGNRRDFPEPTMDPDWGTHRWADGTQVAISRHGPADGEHLVAFWPVRGLLLKCELHARDTDELRHYQPVFEALLIRSWRRPKRRHQHVGDVPGGLHPVPVGTDQAGDRAAHRLPSVRDRLPLELRDHPGCLAPENHRP